jgi:hypothetical protein
MVFREIPEAHGDGAPSTPWVRDKPLSRVESFEKISERTKNAREGI